MTLRSADASAPALDAATDQYLRGWMSLFGTNPTYLGGLTMSVDRGRPEVVGAQVETTHLDRRYLRSYPASVLSGLLI
jgi:hypothetical protein